MCLQATHINFICPMRFDNFPLDTQVMEEPWNSSVELSDIFSTVVNFQTCKFQVGSYSYDMAKMIFTQSNKVSGYVKTAHSVVLDYAVCQIFLARKCVFFLFFQIFFVKYFNTLVCPR